MPATRRRTQQSRARRAQLADAAAGGTPPPRPWFPPGGLEIEVERVGISWEAVKAPAYLGDRALPLLGDGCGAVIRDPYAHVVYWLTPVGTAAAWVVLPHVAVLGGNSFLAVPPGHRTRGLGPYWAVAPTRERVLTDPAELHAALTHAVGTAFGTEPVR